MSQGPLWGDLTGSCLVTVLTIATPVPFFHSSESIPLHAIYPSWFDQLLLLCSHLPLKTFKISLEPTVNKFIVPILCGLPLLFCLDCLCWIVDLETNILHLSAGKTQMAGEKKPVKFIFEKYFILATPRPWIKPMPRNDLRHNNDNTGSLNCWATRELLKKKLNAESNTNDAMINLMSPHEFSNP